MSGLILAAGRRRRLQGVMGNHPRCLARVGAHTLILVADGENVGIAKCGRTSAALLVEELHVVESRGFPWIEIDSPEDYWRACSDVLGAIDALGESRPASAAARAAAFHSRRTAQHV